MNAPTLPELIDTLVAAHIAVRITGSHRVWYDMLGSLTKCDS